MDTVVADAAWSLEDATELYQIEGWSHGYFGVNSRGHLELLPQRPQTSPIDLKELIDELQERGIALPILLRFPDLLHARSRELHTAFGRAISEYGYGNRYQGVYPIKVNQDRYVVEELLRAGAEEHFGLEAGSKPELIAVLAMLEDPDALIICNGYKDEEYIQTALLASRLGRKVIVVVEKFSELSLIVESAAGTGIAPSIGIRARLNARGAGHWQESAGERSKFGLSGRRILEAFRFLEEHGQLSSLKLLHFHLGSQVSSIRPIKQALTEATRVYAELKQMGAPLGYFDVGGGLGVDYDGSQSDSVSSINYTLQEYANDVVSVVQDLCLETETDPPVLVSESGRALVAPHAALVAEVLGSRRFSVGELPQQIAEDAPAPLHTLFETWNTLGDGNLLESWHDARHARDEALSLFSLGYLALRDRGTTEEIFWAICNRILEQARTLEEIPEELAGLEEELADAYFLNFSVFQSLPDAWAIDQLFPVLPIHRLDETPTRRAVLTDITCDSDGQLNDFIDRRQSKHLLEVHEFTEEPYYFGAFLVGAYQEILGDMHNLFGDTHTVHVGWGTDGGYEIQHVVMGDSVSEVLEYVEYRPEDLVSRVRQAAEGAVRSGTMTLKESRRLLAIYEEGLRGYTYITGIWNGGRGREGLEVTRRVIARNESAK